MTDSKVCVARKPCLAHRVTSVGPSLSDRAALSLSEYHPIADHFGKAVRGPIWESGLSDCDGQDLAVDWRRVTRHGTSHLAWFGAGHSEGRGCISGLANRETRLLVQNQLCCADRRLTRSVATSWAKAESAYPRPEHVRTLEGWHSCYRRATASIAVSTMTKQATPPVAK